jgi:hypothetical protein
VVVWRFVRQQNQVIDGLAGDLEKMAVFASLDLCQMAIVA